MKIIHTILLLSTTILTSCAEYDDYKHSTSVIELREYDPRLIDSYNEFLNQADRFGATIDRQLHSLLVVGDERFDQINPKSIGLCWVGFDRDQNLAYEVWIRESVLESEWMLRYTMTHELGHCLLGLEHKEDPSFNIMSSTYPGESRLPDNWDYLLLLLFSM